MKVKVIGSHESSLRETWWYLEQDADGTLHVRTEHTPTGEKTKETRVPLNDYMVNGSARKELQELIDLMFV